METLKVFLCETGHKFKSQIQKLQMRILVKMKTLNLSLCNAEHQLYSLGSSIGEQFCCFQVNLWMVSISATSSRVPFWAWSHNLYKKLSTTSLNQGDSFKPSSPASAFLSNSLSWSWFTYLMLATSSGLGFTFTSRTIKRR